MSKSIQEVTLTELRLKDVVICQLYNALYMRQNCSNCGGAGHEWVFVGCDGEPERDICQCTQDAHEVLEELKSQFMNLMSDPSINLEVSENDQYFTAFDEIKKIKNKRDWRW